MKINKKYSKLNLIFLAALSLSYLYPWLYMLARSFMLQEPGISGNGQVFTLKHYLVVIGDAGFLTYMLNSSFVLTVVLAANIVISTTAGYAFARYRFPFKNILFYLVLATLMIPKQTLMIPISELMVKIGLFNTLWALILPFCADGFNLFLIKQYIESLPPELEDAARADGASEIAILRHIVFPLIKPALTVLIINTAIINWNSFLFPLILTDTASVRTLPVALSMFSQGPYSTDWGALMAGATVSSLPIITLFLIFQKEIISGITKGALKE